MYTYQLFVQSATYTDWTQSLSSVSHLHKLPSELTVIHLQIHVWVAYVNKWLGCDTWVCIHAHYLLATVERKFNFKTESHCLQNNHVHKCGCMTKLICQHTRTQILGVLPDGSTFSCGQADEREMDGSKSRGVWSTSAELRGEASWKCSKVQEDHSTTCNSKHFGEVCPLTNLPTVAADQRKQTTSAVICGCHSNNYVSSIVCQWIL